jgi:hypothetical protein
MRRLNAAVQWLGIQAVAVQGSPWFLLVHLVWWFVWMGRIEARPWETLTLMVSLEAIVQTSLVAMGQRHLARQVTAAATPANPGCRHCTRREACSDS